MTRPSVATAGVVLASALVVACGSPGNSRVTSPEQPATTTFVGSSTSPVEPVTTGPAPAVSRPGPPAVGRCAVSIDGPTPARGGTVTATVRSGVPGRTILARAAGTSETTTGNATTDASGQGSVQLRVPDVPAGSPVQLDVSAGGGAEVCSTTFVPR